MTKKELSQLRHLNREIEKDKRRLKELESASEGGTGKLSGMPHVTGENRKLENYTMMIDAQKTIIEQKIKQTIVLYVELTAYVDSVEDILIREILRERYINGKSWNAVAIKVGGNNTADGCRMAANRFLERH